MSSTFRPSTDLYRNWVEAGFIDEEQAFEEAAKRAERRVALKVQGLIGYVRQQCTEPLFQAHQDLVDRLAREAAAAPGILNHQAD